MTILTTIVLGIAIYLSLLFLSYFMYTIVSTVMEFDTNTKKQSTNSTIIGIATSAAWALFYCLTH